MINVPKPLSALLQRLRYQFLLGWLMAVALPIAFSWFFFRIPLFISTQYITEIAIVM